MTKHRDDRRTSKIFLVIGNNIARLRGDTRQEDLAQKSGVSRATISLAERGQPISLSNLIKLADALGVHPGDLFISDDDRHDVGIKTKLLIQKVYESLNPNKQEG